MITRTSAVAISRRLRSMGYLPLPADRSRLLGGIHVSTCVRKVVVAIHEDDERTIDAQATAEKIRAELIAAGYDVDPLGRSASGRYASVWVNGRVTA